MKKYKVLIVHNYYQIPGGEDTVVANEKKLLEKHGHEVIFYSRNNSELKELSLFKKIFLPITTIFNFRTYYEIKRLIKNEQIDIVHIHNVLNLVSSSVYYAALRCRKPVIQTVHNFRLLCPGATFYRDGHICEDCVTKGLTCAIKHNCYRGSKIQTLACVVSSLFHRMTGIYKKINYICLTEFNKKKLLKLKQIKDEQIFIKPNFTYDMSLDKRMGDFYLFIGRIEEIKGISLLIEAFAKMPDKKLLVAGTGTESAMNLYQSEVQKRELTNINFLGFVEREKLVQLIAESKAVIVCSQCYETFGMIVAEAFAGRTPVIVGDIGNVASLVDDGVNGIKFRYNEPDDLVCAIEKYENCEIQVMAEQAYQKYVDEFSEDVNYRRLCEIYDSLLK